MRKVMLVIDDFRELVGLESFLRRLGFDVLSLNKESLVNDALLSFQPEIVIASFRGRNIDGERLAVRLKKAMVPPPRIALAYSGAKPHFSEETKKSIEALAEIPLVAETAIQMMAQLSGLSSEPLLQKYAKVSSAVLTQEEQIVIVSGKEKAAAKKAASVPPPPSAGVRTERSDRYEKFLALHGDEVPDKVLPHDLSKKAMKKLKEHALSEKDELDRIDAEKQKFVKALFKK